VDAQEIGRRLRSLRAASGRTVASVALEAGLSVPYVANLENGRGNPTLSALSRLGAALGTELTVSFDPPDDGARNRARTPVTIPLPLIRLSRRARFRHQAGLAAAGLGQDREDVTARMINGVALAAAALDRDLAEADYWRLIDALTIIAATTGLE
jgi:transcriptional regulator with XRE-family HTH domain